MGCAIAKALKRIMAMYKHREGYTLWWPGETKDEIAIGAVLAQATSWRNAERALENLKMAGKLTLAGILECERLEELIRPAGFAKRKAVTLRRLARYLLEGEPTRHGLLSIPGIGEETADAILCYAYRTPEFVADAYSRRLLERLCGLKLDYSRAKQAYEAVLSGWREMAHAHASIVEFSKSVCRARPLCSQCPLRKACLYGSGKQLK